MERVSEVFVNSVEADSGRDMSLNRTSETFADIVVRSERGMSYDRLSETFADTAVVTSDWYGEEWALDGKQIGTRMEEVRTWQNLSLTLFSSESKVKNRLDPYITDAGKQEVVDVATGGFHAVDRSQGRNKFKLKAPAKLKTPVDLRPIEDYYVDSYEKELLNPQGDEYEITLNLMPESEKAFDKDHSWIDGASSVDGRTIRYTQREIVKSDKWHFRFAASDILTDKVVADLAEEVEGGVSLYDVAMVLSIRDTVTIEESLSKNNSVRLIEVPDGTNKYEDKSSDQRQMVEITPPNTDAEQTIPQGSFVVEDWSSSWVGNVYEVNLTIAINQDDI